jgi:hypothetical protein
MFGLLAEVASRSRGIGPEGIGIGAGGAVLLTVLAWLAKAGLTGNFRIGGNGQAGRDAEMDRVQAREDREETRKEGRYNREACDLKHSEIEAHLLRNDLHADKLEEKMEAGFHDVGVKLDRLTDHLLRWKELGEKDP